MADKTPIDKDQRSRLCEISRAPLRELIKAAEPGSAKIMSREIWGEPAIAGFVAMFRLRDAEACAFVHEVAGLPALYPRQRGCVNGMPAIDRLPFRIAAPSAD
jgi:hypothetical protein